MSGQFHRGAKIAPKQNDEMTDVEMIGCFTQWMAKNHPEITTWALCKMVEAIHPIALQRWAPGTPGEKQP